MNDSPPMDDLPLPCDLAPRFGAPPGWRWGWMEKGAGRRLRFGAVVPDAPRAIVVGLQGLSEFAEKYFETARDMTDRGYGFFMMDWQGQGGSYRPLRNPQKRHARRFDDDLADLGLFLRDHVFPAATRPDGTRLPVIMLAHSMGAHMGLRHVLSHPGLFDAAVFSAPLVGIYALRAYPAWLARMLTRGLGLLMGRRYVQGGGDWCETRRDGAILSSDPVRGAVQRAWFTHAPALRVGNVTYGWLRAASDSCRILQRGIRTEGKLPPCLFVLAGRENLVDNAAARALAALMPGTELMEIEESGHEILMESDTVRQRFFTAFDDFLSRNGVIPRLKQEAGSGKVSST